MRPAAACRSTLTPRGADPFPTATIADTSGATTGSEHKLRPVDLPPIPLPAGRAEYSKRGVLAAFSLAHYVMTAIRAWGTICSLRRSARSFASSGSRSVALSSPSRSGSCIRAERRWSRQSGRTTRTMRAFRSCCSSRRALKRAYPLLGYQQIANWLGRAGIQTAATTVRRMLQMPLTDRPRPPPPDTARAKKSDNAETARTVAAPDPGHVWNCDVTTVPTSVGLSLSWCPFPFPPLFPFCHKVVCVLDHFFQDVARAWGVQAGAFR